MEKVGNSEPNQNEVLLKEAESQIKKKHHEDVAQRMGRVAARETLQHKSNESEYDAMATDLLGDFFADISSENVDNKEQLETPEQDSKMERATDIMRELIKDNFVDACYKNRSLENQKTGYEMLYALALERSHNGAFSRNQKTDEIVNVIPKFDNEIKDLAQSSPEAYVAVYGTKLRENIKNRDDGWMMETPYVKEHAERLNNNMTKGRPTFIHGHLGSGKTELAITVAKEFMVAKAAKKEALNEITKYTLNHDIQDNEERAELFGKFYQRSHDILKNKLAKGDDDAVEKFSPLIVSGSGDMGTADLYLDKNLKLAKYNGTDTAGHKDQYDEAFNKWKSDYQKNYEGLSDEERTTREAKDSEEFFKLYVAEHQAYGTEVELVTKPLLQAMEEGKPFILDEANAVPTAVLISLNDVLQRRPGDTCFVPGKGQIEIQDGFSMTMTGNLSTSNVDYGGTNELNPAFLSRPDVFEYSYLPQSESGKLEEQEDMSKNQLFQVMVTYLTDRQGNLELPEIDESVDKLFRLAQFAHQTQQIFAGKNIKSATYTNQSGDNVDVKLKDSVLSIRNVLKVLEKWNKGESMDLNKALWDGFISSVTNANEQQTFLKLAQNYGFFSEKNDWQINAIKPDALVDFDDIHPGGYEFKRSPLEVYTMADTVDLIYGNRPERDFYPEFTFDDLDNEDGEGLDELLDEEYKELGSIQKEFKDATAALEVLAEQCGCENLVGE